MTRRRAGEQDTGSEARLVANLGLAAALSHGRLSPRDLRLAASQYTVARTDAPLTGVIIWLPSGRSVFAAGAGRADAAAHGEPPIVRHALMTGRTEVADATGPRAARSLPAESAPQQWQDRGRGGARSLAPTRGAGCSDRARCWPPLNPARALLRGLTQQVLDHAIHDCANWLREGVTLSVAVNVAPVLMLDGSLVAMVHDLLRRYELDPCMLTLVLTESALMQPDDDVTAPLAELRASGISVSIDDFGTGNSSLARLRSLPLDELKIDRSFIAGIAPDERDFRITRHVVGLGADLGLQVVAEGVEDRRTLRLLRNLGCDAAQGFYLSKPLPESQLRAWLEQEQLRCRFQAGATRPW
jgi:EAL domain-containing protein (putative c-di-GMP-specific phosphodiesterase class I)